MFKKGNTDKINFVKKLLDWELRKALCTAESYQSICHPEFEYAKYLFCQTNTSNC